jgi:hypothetical protein
LTDPVLSKSTSNGRFYVRPGRFSEVPSITNIIGMKDKPALKWWAARQAAEFAADNVDTIKALKRAEAIDLIKGAPFRKTGDSANVGDIVHNWIDQYIKMRLQSPGITFDPDPAFSDAPRTAQKMWGSFMCVVQKYNPQWIASEFTVWSETHEYAGTGDWMARIGGRIVLGDTKTGNGVYPEVGMQCAALEYADYALDAEGNEYQLPNAEAFGVLHVRPTYARLSPLEGIPACYKAFLGLREVHRWMCETSESVIRVAPKIENTLKIEAA